MSGFQAGQDHLKQVSALFMQLSLVKKIYVLLWRPPDYVSPKSRSRERMREKE